MTYGTAGAGGVYGMTTTTPGTGGLLTENSAEITRQFASIVSSPFDDSGLQNGMIPAGGDLHVETMTIEAAKRMCAKLPGCAGFTFQGLPTKELVTIYFKDRWEFIPSSVAGQWTSYNATQEEQLPIPQARMTQTAGSMRDHSRLASGASKQSLGHSSRTAGDGKPEMYQYRYSTKATSPSIIKTSLPRPDFGDELDLDMQVITRPPSTMNMTPLVPYPVMPPPPTLYSHARDEPEEQPIRQWRPLSGAYVLGWRVGEHGVIEPIGNFLNYIGQMLIHGYGQVSEVSVKPVGGGFAALLIALGIGVGKVAAFGAGIGSGITYGVVKPAIEVGSDVAKPVASGVVYVGSSISSGASKVKDNVAVPLASGVVAGATSVGAGVVAGASYAGGGLAKGAGAIVGVTSDGLEAAGDGARYVGSGVATAASGAMHKVGDLGSDLKASAADGMSNVASGVAAVGSGVESYAAKGMHNVGDAVSGLQGYAADGMSNVASGAAVVGSGMESYASRGMSNVISGAAAVGSGVESYASKGMHNVGDAVSGLQGYAADGMSAFNNEVRGPQVTAAMGSISLPSPSLLPSSCGGPEILPVKYISTPAVQALSSSARVSLPLSLSQRSPSPTRSLSPTPYRVPSEEYGVLDMVHDYIARPLGIADDMSPTRSLSPSPMSSASMSPERNIYLPPETSVYTPSPTSLGGTYIQPTKQYYSGRVWRSTPSQPILYTRRY